MFIKNINAYKLETKLAKAELTEVLESKPAREPGTQELSAYGFTAPVKQSSELVIEAGDYMLICAEENKRDLPASVVKAEFDKQVEKIEHDQCRKVYKKERDQIKDEVIMRLLPSAFIKTSRIYAIICNKSSMIYIGHSSKTKCEEMLNAIRSVLGSLPVRPLELNLEQCDVMTKILRYGSHVFECGTKATLKDIDGIETVKFTNHDLGSEEVIDHIDAGKVVTEIELLSKQDMRFVLNEKLTLKQVKYPEREDDESDFIGDLAIAGGLLTLLIGDLANEFGGINIPERI